MSTNNERLTAAEFNYGGRLQDLYLKRRIIETCINAVQAYEEFPQPFGSLSKPRCTEALSSLRCSLNMVNEFIWREEKIDEHKG